MAAAQDIPLSSLTDFTQNVRTGDAEDALHISELAEDIEQNGLLHPITVRPADGGKFAVVAGRRRVLACQKLGLEVIPAVVKTDLSDRDGFLLSLSENSHRRNMSHKQQTRAIKRCFDECEGDIDRVREFTHLSKTTLKRYLDIAELPNNLIERLDSPGDDRLTLKDAQIIARGGIPPSSDGGGGGAGAGAATAASAHSQAPPLLRSEVPESLRQAAMAAGVDLNDPDVQLHGVGVGVGGGAPDTRPAKQRKRSVKMEPWVYDFQGDPATIPPALHQQVYELVHRLGRE